MEFECKLEYLADIIEELTAREQSNNSVIPPLQWRTWDELCEEGIRLFAELSD
jgi:hypothetical protein